MRKTFLPILLLVSSFLISANTVYAGSSIYSGAENMGNSYITQSAGYNCVERANQVAAGYANAQILSVENSGNSCIIVIRVPGTNGNPPRIISETVSG